MKRLILIFATLTLGTFAQASNLECVNRGRATAPSQSDISFKAQIASPTQLRNIVVISKGANGGTSDSVGTARQNVCDASSNYNPRKFVDANQFVLELKNDKKNQWGTAVDECQFILMIPKTITYFQPGVHFTIPMLVHCDQSGGREDLNCNITSY